MCGPHDRVLREKMIGSVKKESGVGQPRRRPATRQTFRDEIRRADRRAAVAGGLLLTMLQLHSNGYRPSLNPAIPLVSALLPKWKQPEGPIGLKPGISSIGLGLRTACLEPMTDRRRQLDDKGGSGGALPPLPPPRKPAVYAPLLRVKSLRSGEKSDMGVKVDQGDAN